MLDIISQMNFNADTNSYFVDKYELTDGEYLDVLVFNGLTQKAEWIYTCLEYSEDTNKWYLEGLLGYSIQGLFAKIDR